MPLAALREPMPCTAWLHVPWHLGRLLQQHRQISRYQRCCVPIFSFHEEELWNDKVISGGCTRIKQSSPSNAKTSSRNRRGIWTSKWTLHSGPGLSNSDGFMWNLQVTNFNKVNNYPDKKMNCTRNLEPLSMNKSQERHQRPGVHHIYLPLVPNLPPTKSSNTSETRSALGTAKSWVSRRNHDGFRFTLGRPGQFRAREVWLGGWALEPSSNGSLKVAQTKVGATNNWLSLH